MPKVRMEISMSVDGYVVGPDVSPKSPMGPVASACTT